VPDTAYTHFDSIDTAAVDAILARYDFDTAEMLPILESIQRAYGYLPVAALKRVSQVSGAPYALIYGTATYYSHLRFERAGRTVAVCRCTSCSLAGSSESLAYSPGSWVRRSAAGRRPARGAGAGLGSRSRRSVAACHARRDAAACDRGRAAAWARALAEGAWHDFGRHPDDPGALPPPAAPGDTGA